MSRPTDTLLAALARRREQHRTHPWPQLIPTPPRWCRECRTHLANQGGPGDQNTLCVCCESA